MCVCPHLKGPPQPSCVSIVPQEITKEAVGSSIKLLLGGREGKGGVTTVQNRDCEWPLVDPTSRVLLIPAPTNPDIETVGQAVAIKTDQLVIYIMRL
jgi:hypothetical protein